MKYTVTFTKHFDESGCGDDYPTDFLRFTEDANPDFVEMRPPTDGGEFGEEEWSYEVEDRLATSFERALDACETVKSYTALYLDENGSSVSRKEFFANDGPVARVARLARHSEEEIRNMLDYLFDHADPEPHDPESAIEAAVEHFEAQGA